MASDHEDISALMTRAVAAFNALSPVEQGLHLADQRRSFVRGQCGHDPGPDVLAEEVRRLQAEAASERSARIRAEARVAELLEALKPFAYQFADDVRDQELVVVAETDEGRFYKVKVSAFRRARSITTGEG